MNKRKGVSTLIAGNYTKGAVESFEEHIVREENYLEKVHDNLESLKDENFQTFKSEKK